MSEPRYSIWAPVGGNFGPLNTPDEPINASYERTRSLVLEAERLGYVTTLVAQHLANPCSLDLEQLETWTACAALAEATESIEIIAAIKLLLFYPAVLAKMALGIDAISHGRFAINLISAWFRPEMERTNIPFPPHDERYRYSGEWLQVVRALWSGERVNFEGEYFKIQDLSLRPFSVAQPYPRIYLGGASDPAQILAAQQADVYFINGQPIEDIRKVNSVVELSISPVFRRQWSSIYEAIEDSLPPRFELMQLYITQLPQTEQLVLAGDHTAWPRPNACTLKDRTYEHQAQPMSGAKPVAAGQGYSNPSC